MAKILFIIYTYWTEIHLAKKNDFFHNFENAMTKAAKWTKKMPTIQSQSYIVVVYIMLTLFNIYGL
jgi:hypothetical protein